MLIEQKDTNVVCANFVWFQFQYSFNCRGNVRLIAFCIDRFFIKIIALTKVSTRGQFDFQISGYM